MPEVGDAHMPDAPSHNVPSQDTPSPSRSLALRPHWPSPAQVALGALGKEEPFTPVPSQRRSEDTYLPSRAAHLLPHLQVNAFKVPTEISTHTLNTMGAAHSTLPPTDRKADVSKVPTPEGSTSDTVDWAPRMESLLEPVSCWLARLQGTTLPPYNPRVQANRAAQVLSDRLLPVGRHVLKLLKSEGEVAVSEVDIW